MKLLQSKLIAPFMEKDVKRDLILQKLTVFLLCNYAFLVPMHRVFGLSWGLVWRVEVYIIFIVAWIMLLYGASFLMKPEKESYHRWILLIASITGIPVSINVARLASAGMQNKVTRKISQVLTFIVTWYVFYRVFISLGSLISKALGIA